jgi:selenocysteine lyase/cysteine desulfurase
MFVLYVRLLVPAGAAWIEQREVDTARRVHARLAANPAIHLLGHPHPQTTGGSGAGAGAGAGRYLPIVSFLVQPLGTERCLHYNFVCALLNDLFGVQSRGGCMCAGPYSQLLLGIPSSSPASDAETDADANSTSDDGACTLNAHFLARNLAIENAVLDKQEVQLMIQRCVLRTQSSCIIAL